MNPIFCEVKKHAEGTEGEWTTIDIVFEAWHSGENSYERLLSVDGNVWCDMVWDSYRDEEVLEALGVEGKELALANVRLRHFGINFQLTDLTMIGGGEVLCLRGEIHRVREVVKKWIETVANDVWGVGGDDSYFDYYPDNFYVLSQLEGPLDLKKEADKARAYVKAARYDDEEGDDLIG